MDIHGAMNVFRILLICVLSFVVMYGATKLLFVIFR